MRCSAVLEDDAFVLSAEDVPVALAPVMEAAFFQRDNGDERFVKRYPPTVEDQDAVSENFPRLAPAMFSGEDADWEGALNAFADRCDEANIEWYATGSVCDALRKIAITPHDLDLVVHTRDIWRTRDLFRDAMIEPFVDNGGTWVVQYFGRICLANIQVDVVADPSRDAEAHRYEAIEWRGHRIRVEPFDVRYRTEIERARQDRIAAFEAWMGSEATGSP